MSNKLPVIIQTIVFRKKGEGVDVLLLKRTEERGGFWNVVNGTMELTESVFQCRERELREETEIQNIIHWSDELYRFSFRRGEDVFIVIVFAAEVSADQAVVINDEHTEFQWVSADNALQILKFDDDKKALQKFLEKRSAFG